MTAIDTDVSAVQRMFDINVFGPMRMVRGFHEMIIGAKGTIVNISSIGGLIPFVYGCSSRPILFPHHLRAGNILICAVSILQCEQSGPCPLGKHSSCGNGSIWVSCHVLSTAGSKTN